MEGKISHKRSVGRRVAIPSDTPSVSRGREYRAVLFGGTAIFLLLCLISYDPRDPSLNVATTRGVVSNWCGLFGSHVADALIQILGLSALIAPIGLGVLALRLLVPPRSRLGWLDYLSLFVGLSSFSALLERFSAGSFAGYAVQHPGGAIGAFLHASIFAYLGSAGEVVLSLTLVLICALHLSGISVQSIVALGRALGQWVCKMAGLAWQNLKTDWENQQLRRVIEKAPVQAERAPTKKEPVEPAFVPIEADVDLSDIGIPAWERLSCLPQEELRCAGNGADRIFSPQDVAPVTVREQAQAEQIPWRPLKKDGNGKAKTQETVSVQALEQAISEYLKEQAAKSKKKEVVKAQAPSQAPAQEEAARPIRVTRRADLELQPAETPKTDRVLDDDYMLPPASLLDPPRAETRAVDEKVLEDNAAVLEQKLLDLGIKGQVVEVHPGPVITMYELNLAPGIPLRKVLSTCDDLAMALKCGSTRVVAPIHGKDTVGIEVPNLNREIVYFREIIESAAFSERTGPLKLALGKCIDGEPFATSLTRMPHLLIAGATGTGKSVGLNVMISSWLMTCHPDDVKFLMVDPKKLELSYYQDIPHLIHPVVTEAEKVPKVLSWAIREMERRYDLLSRAGAKNIEGFNEKVRTGQLASEGEEKPAEKLPYIVIIIDELAELMMVAAKDIEISIARLAQMARASGIHLILATQRPSVDVITGVIKANFPARISYQVSAKPDSRTILDTTGAENLLGMGDMLFLPPGTAKMRRLHGAYVSEDEISRIVDFIKAQRAPVYLQEISNHVADEDARAAGAELIDDTKYDEAVELVARLGHASISLIQRHMRIGYNRAARIIEAMEAEGIIGPSDGTSRPREVLARSLAHIPDTNM
jgi:S-DNA-T family DNA segregation ATPase FtsK/SpoIIIE